MAKATGKTSTGGRGRKVVSLDVEVDIVEADLERAVGGAGAQQSASTKKGTDIIEHGLQSLGHEVNQQLTTGDHHIAKTQYATPSQPAEQPAHQPTAQQPAHQPAWEPAKTPTHEPAHAPMIGTNRGDAHATTEGGQTSHGSSGWTSAQPSSSEQHGDKPVIGSHRQPESQPETTGSSSGRQSGAWSEQKGANHLASLLDMPDTSNGMSHLKGSTPQIDETHSSHSGIISTTQTEQAGITASHDHTHASAAGGASYDQVTHIGPHVTVDQGASAGFDAHIGPTGGDLHAGAEVHQYIDIGNHVSLDETAGGTVNAHIGPTGASATAQAGFEATLHGPGGIYAGEQATAGAGAHAGLGAGTLGFGAEAGTRLGMDAGVDHTFHAPKHVDINAGAQVEASVRADATAEASIGKGGIRYGEGAFAGDYEAATVHGGVHHDGTGGSGTIGVIAPGSVGENVNVHAGVKDGVMSFTLGGTADVGLFGVTGSATIDINVKPVIQGAEYLYNHQPEAMRHVEGEIAHGAIQIGGAALGDAMHIGQQVSHDVQQGVHTATTVVTHAVTTGEHAVAQTVTHAATTVEHGVQQAASTVQHGVQQAASTVEHGVEHAASTVEHAASSAAHSVAHALTHW